MNLAQEELGIWVNMNLHREEIFFVRGFLQELRNKHIERFPFKTKAYTQALKKIKEHFEKNPPEPLDMLLTTEPITSYFPRINSSITRCLGEDLQFLSPYYDTAVLRQYYRKVEDPLVKKFTEKFIEHLNLR